MNKIKVLEFEGLAPSVFCGQFFSDIGCDRKAFRTNFWSTHQRKSYE